MTRINGIPQPSATSLADAPLFGFQRQETFRDALHALNRFLVSRGQRIGQTQPPQFGKGRKRKS